ncbi:MAG: phasin family protein [Burkholderiaceae bacterium]|nr:phasin family protein [Burkholderiaceae bacterium]
MLTIDHLMDAQKAQLTALHEISSKALSTAEKIAGLHMQATKASWAQQTHHVHALLSAKTPQELITLQSSALQPLAENASAYGRDLFGITSGLGQDWSKLSEYHVADVQKNLTVAVQKVFKHTPQGPSAVLSAFKDAVSTATDAVESMQKVVKQTTDLAQASMAVAAENTAAN